MANFDELKDVLPGTGGADNIDRGAFLHNTFVRRSAHQVRPGFGQLGSFTATNTQGSETSKAFMRQLGSQGIVTDFGHTQIVSVWVADAALLETFEAAPRNESITQDGHATLFLVEIYDKTTNVRWEEALYGHTADRGDSSQPMPFWRAHYQGQTRWTAANDEKHVFFCNSYGVLFFGHENIGTWCYVPADYRNQMAHTTNQRQGVGGSILPNDWRGESCRIFPLAAQPTGDFGRSYLGKSSFPKAVDACAWGGRIVYAADRFLYFSDVARPASIDDVNIVELPTQEPLVAVAETAGMVVAFTPNETWVYRPVSGQIAGGGDARRLSDSVGCLGPLAKARRMEQLFWADEHGVYTFSGGMSLKMVSDPIAALFDDGMSLPLSTYYATTGLPVTVANDIESFVRWPADQTVHLTYDAFLDVLLIGMPDQNAALCLSKGSTWSLWSMETFCVDSGRSSKSLPSPYFAAVDDAIFLTAGPHSVTLQNERGSARTTTYFTVSEWGVGGALDRNVGINSDQRYGLSYHSKIKQGTDAGYFAVGPPTRVPIGAMIGRIAATDETWLFPIYLNPDVAQIAISRLHFTFDQTVWDPVLFDVPNNDVDYDLPAQRLAARDIFGHGVVNPGTNEIRVYAGNEIRINAVGATAAVSWGHHPYLNVAAGNLEPYVWLPFRRIGGLGTPASLMLSVNSATMTDGAAAAYDLSVFQWVGSLPVTEDDDFTQAIDWAIKSNRVELPARSQGRLRGMFLRALSNGEPVDVGVGFVHGLLNATFQTDMREWSTQLADFSLGLSVAEKVALRARMLGVTSVVNTRTLNNVATWSSEASPTHGNYLIDDEQVDTRSLSLSARGQNFAVMAFGHIRGRGQKLMIDGMDVAIRTVGKTRRWGR